MQTILVFGATGTAGSGAIRAALDELLPDAPDESAPQPAR